VSNLGYITNNDGSGKDYCQTLPKIIAKEKIKYCKLHMPLKRPQAMQRILKESKGKEFCKIQNASLNI
jgi:hypothetical protein